MTGSVPRVVEHVRFRLAVGAERDAFLAASKGLHGWLKSTGAVVQRTLTQQADGEWNDIVMWTSLEAAQQAAKDIESVPQAGAFMNLIDPTTIVLTHSTIEAHETDF